MRATRSSGIAASPLRSRSAATAAGITLLATGALVGAAGAAAAWDGSSGGISVHDDTACAGPGNDDWVTGSFSVGMSGFVGTSGVLTVTNTTGWTEDVRLDVTLTDGAACSDVVPLPDGWYRIDFTSNENETDRSTIRIGLTESGGTSTPTPTESETPSETPTDTGSPMPTVTATESPTDTGSPLPTETVTETPTETPSDTGSALPTATATSSPTEGEGGEVVPSTGGEEGVVVGGGSAAGPGELAHTGSTSPGLLGAAAALVAMGAGLLGLARRPRRH